MKLTLTLYADDVTALAEALEQVKEGVALGKTISMEASDEWAYKFDVIDNKGME